MYEIEKHRFELTQVNQSKCKNSATFVIPPYETERFMAQKPMHYVK